MKSLLAVLVGVALADAAVAGNSALQLSLTPDIAICARSETIEGLVLSAWGENPQTALALGIVNGSTGQSAGLSSACVLNYAENYRGIQCAPINFTKGDFAGLQSGLVNYAGRLTGLQLGLVNYAATAETGVQLGLVNLIPKNRWFGELPDGLAPGMFLVNWRF